MWVIHFGHLNYYDFQMPVSFDKKERNMRPGLKIKWSVFSNLRTLEKLQMPDHTGVYKPLAE